MQKPENLKVGDQFRVTERYNGFNLGEIITLKKDDGTNCPFFWKEDKSGYRSMFWSELEPYTKTVRYAQVGDVVVRRDGDECMVLERGQNTVVVSLTNNFKRTAFIFTFDELEEDFTLKDEPEVDSIMAEVMEILKSKGYKIVKK